MDPTQSVIEAHEAWYFPLMEHQGYHRAALHVVGTGMHLPYVEKTDLLYGKIRFARSDVYHYIYPGVEHVHLRDVQVPLFRPLQKYNTYVSHPPAFVQFPRTDWTSPLNPRRGQHWMSHDIVQSVGENRGDDHHIRNDDGGGAESSGVHDDTDGTNGGGEETTVLNVRTEDGDKKTTETEESEKKTETVVPEKRRMCGDYSDGDDDTDISWPPLPKQQTPGPVVVDSVLNGDVVSEQQTSAEIRSVLNGEVASTQQTPAFDIQKKPPPRLTPEASKVKSPSILHVDVAQKKHRALDGDDSQKKPLTKEIPVVDTDEVSTGSPVVDVEETAIPGLARSPISHLIFTTEVIEGDGLLVLLKRIDNMAWDWGKDNLET